MFRKSLLAFTGAAALSALAFAPLVSADSTVTDGKALAAAAGDLDTTFDVEKVARDTIEPVDCVVGVAGPFFCNNVDLVDQVPTAGFGNAHGSDSWGWTDDDGTEYVIVTSGVGTGFFRLTDDGTTEYLGSVERTDTADRILWNDVKVVNDHAYISSEDTAYGLQVVDMNEVAALPAIPLGTGAGVVQQVGHKEGDGSHNVVAFEEAGVVAMSAVADDVCGGDIVFYDVLQTPADPQRLGCLGGSLNSQLAGGSHDAQCVVYSGPDDDFNGTNDPNGEASHICVLFQEGAGVFVADVTDITRDKVPGATGELLARFTYDDIAYAHQGWFTDDQRWVIFGDELDEFSGAGSNANEFTTTYYIDLTDLDAGGKASLHQPIVNDALVGEFNNGNTLAIDHNMYIVGDLVYQANYGAGLRVLRFSDKSLEAGLDGSGEPFEEVAYFDTYPGPGPAAFYGAWNVYPFFESGNIVLSDFEAGLLILDVRDEVVNPDS